MRQPIEQQAILSLDTMDKILSSDCVKCLPRSGKINELQVHPKYSAHNQQRLECNYNVKAKASAVHFLEKEVRASSDNQEMDQKDAPIPEEYTEKDQIIVPAIEVVPDFVCCEGCSPS